MLKPLLLVFLLLLLSPLSACGPIYGQLTKVTDDVDIEVTAGKLSDLRQGGKLLVVGPFTRDRGAYYICRGEEANAFASTMKEQKVFITESLYTDADLIPVEQLRSRNGRTLQAELNLAATPDYLLLGNIRYRQLDVIPVRGVVMTVGYTLEFIDLKTGQATVIDIDVKDEQGKCIDAAVAELARELASAG